MQTHISPSTAEWSAAIIAGIPAALVSDLVRPYLSAFLESAWWKARRWWIVVRERLQAAVRHDRSAAEEMRAYMLAVANMR